MELLWGEMNLACGKGVSLMEHTITRLCVAVLTVSTLALGLSDHGASASSQNRPAVASSTLSAVQHTSKVQHAPKKTATVKATMRRKYLKKKTLAMTVRFKTRGAKMRVSKRGNLFFYKNGKAIGMISRTVPMSRSDVRQRGPVGYVTGKWKVSGSTLYFYAQKRQGVGHGPARGCTDIKEQGKQVLNFVLGGVSGALVATADRTPPEQAVAVGTTAAVAIVAGEVYFWATCWW